MAMMCSFERSGAGEGSDSGVVVGDQGRSTCLESGGAGAAPTSFEVLMIKDLAGRFSGRRTFIEDLENLIPEFYDRIGQNLRPWSPPPPSIDKRDPIQDTDSVEEPKRDGILAVGGGSASRFARAKGCGLATHGE